MSTNLQLLLETLTLAADDVNYRNTLPSTLRESQAVMRIDTSLTSDEDSSISPVVDRQITNSNRSKQFKRNSMNDKPRERVKS